MRLSAGVRVHRTPSHERSPPPRLRKPDHDANATGEGSPSTSPGGYISLYEEQVVLARPRHDDLRDSAALGFEDLKAPSFSSSLVDPARKKVVQFNNRRGGLSL